MISFLLFTFSFVVILAMFLSRKRAISNGNIDSIYSSFSFLDNFALKIFNALSYRWKQIYQTVRYIIFIVIPQRSEEAFKQMKGRAVDSYNKKKDSLMGKKELINSSSASFFIKKIKEEKKNIKSGKIEETMEM